MGNWTFGLGDGCDFDVYQVEHPLKAHSDANLNGMFPTKADALRSVIHDAEQLQRENSARLRKARRMLRRAEAETPDPNPPASSTEGDAG